VAVGWKGRGGGPRASAGGRTPSRAAGSVGRTNAIDAAGLGAIGVVDATSVAGTFSSSTRCLQQSPPSGVKRVFVERLQHGGRFEAGIRKNQHASARTKNPVVPSDDTAPSANTTIASPRWVNRTRRGDRELGSSIGLHA